MLLLTLSIPIVLSLHPWSSVKSTYIRKISGRINLSSVKLSYYLKRHFLKCLPQTCGVKPVSRLAFTPSCILKNMLSQNNSFLEEFSWEWCLALIPAPIKYQSLQLIRISCCDWSTVVDVPKCSQPRAVDLTSHDPICTAMFPLMTLSVSVELCQCKPQILTTIAYYRAVHIILV